MEKLNCIKATTTAKEQTDVNNVQENDVNTTRPTSDNSTTTSKTV